MNGYRIEAGPNKGYRYENLSTTEASTFTPCAFDPNKACVMAGFLGDFSVEVVQTECQQRVDSAAATCQGQFDALNQQVAEQREF